MAQSAEVDYRRCSSVAGDPQGGCVNYNNGYCLKAGRRPDSVLKAKECTSYIPMLVAVVV